jgi:hypothetical protein
MANERRSPPLGVLGCMIPLFALPRAISGAFWSQAWAECGPRCIGAGLTDRSGIETLSGIRRDDDVSDQEFGRVV